MDQAGLSDPCPEVFLMREREREREIDLASGDKLRTFGEGGREREDEDSPR